MMFWRPKRASKTRDRPGSTTIRTEPPARAWRLAARGAKFLACKIKVVDGRIRHSIDELLLQLPAVMQPFGESVQSSHAKSLPPANDRRIGAEAPHWHGFFRLRSGQPKLRCSVPTALFPLRHT
jgi:hypothetical protein